MTACWFLRQSFLWGFQADRHADTLTHRLTDTPTQTDTDRHRQTHRHAHTQTHRHTDRHTHRNRMCEWQAGEVVYDPSRAQSSCSVNQHVGALFAWNSQFHQDPSSVHITEIAVLAGMKDTRIGQAVVTVLCDLLSASGGLQRQCWSSDGIALSIAIRLLCVSFKAVRAMPASSQARLPQSDVGMYSDENATHPTSEGTTSSTAPSAVATTPARQGFLLSTSKRLFGRATSRDDSYLARNLPEGAGVALAVNSGSVTDQPLSGTVSSRADKASLNSRPGGVSIAVESVRSSPPGFRMPPHVSVARSGSRTRAFARQAPSSAVGSSRIAAASVVSPKPARASGRGVGRRHEQRDFDLGGSIAGVVSSAVQHIAQQPSLRRDVVEDMLYAVVQLLDTLPEVQLNAFESQRSGDSRTLQQLSKDLAGLLVSRRDELSARAHASVCNRAGMRAGVSGVQPRGGRVGGGLYGCVARCRSNRLCVFACPLFACVCRFGTLKARSSWQ